MKISNRTHPILRMLNHDGDFVELTVPSCTHKDQIPIIEKTLEYSWPKLRHKFNSNVCYISETFLQAADLATPKLRENPEMFKLDEGEYNGTFLFRNITICYWLKVTHDEDDNGAEAITARFFVFRNACIITISSFFGEDTSTCSYKFFHDLKEKINKYSYDALTLIVNEWFWITRIWILFKKYAEVETKYLPAGKKTKEKEFGIKYINESKSNITVLDSRWFTTLVKSDSFKVRGHFHLYWYSTKDGVKCEPYRKLVWVNTYDKSGYTAQAKKLKSTNI